MPTINLAYVAELVVKYLRMGAYALLLTSFFLAILGMWGSFFTAFMFFYNVLSNLLSSVTGGGVSTGSLMSMVYGLLSCIGFIDAFNATKIVFIASINFLFARILFSVTLSSYRYFINAISPLAS